MVVHALEVAIVGIRKRDPSAAALWLKARDHCISSRKTSAARRSHVQSSVDNSVSVSLPAELQIAAVRS